MRPYLMQMILVGLGGFVGSASRFVLSGLVHRTIPMSTFPFGTLAVNVIGCLAIGFLGGLMDLRQVLGPSQRMFLLIGVLGGFTTFSTFAFETLGLIHAAQFAKSAVNVAAQVIFGLAAAWIGYFGAQNL